MERVNGPLAVATFFFACYSCEYLKVPQAERRCIDILHLRNICFFKDGVQVYHRHNSLEYTGCVSLAFEWQKKDVQQDMLAQLTTGDWVLCPVRAWAA
eukprot:14597744-Ditylum_brightwellii.AAC.1